MGDILKGIGILLNEFIIFLLWDYVNLFIGVCL